MNRKKWIVMVFVLMGGWILMASVSCRNSSSGEDGYTRGGADTASAPPLRSAPTQSMPGRPSITVPNNSEQSLFNGRRSDQPGEGADYTRGGARYRTLRGAWKMRRRFYNKRHKGEDR